MNAKTTVLSQESILTVCCQSRLKHQHEHQHGQEAKVSLRGAERSCK